MIFRSIRKRLRLFSILSSLILLTPTGSDIHACWYGPEAEELRYMLFNPDLGHNKSWWTFFYNAKLNYLDGSTQTDADEQVLTDEWLIELNVKADERVAFSCFFGSLTDSALAFNPVYQVLQKQTAYREYFDIARRCEAVSSMPDPWLEGEERDTAIINQRSALIESVSARVAKERNPFLKKKYAFQLSKLAFYASDRPLFNQTYNHHFAQADRDVLYWWATHYKSMMLEREGQVDSANYLHALVFSHAGSKRFISRQFFVTKRLEAVLALAQNNRERADILVLAEAINPGRSLEGIRKIYALDPGHKLLPLLISREINKIEDWLGTTKYAEAPKSVFLGDDSYTKPILENWKRDFAYLGEVVQEFEDMDKLSLFSEYGLFMSYLNLLRGDDAAAVQYLSGIESNDPEVQYQIQVQQVVLLTLQEDVMNPAVQEKLGRMFQSLIDGSAQKFESEKMLYSLSSYLRYVFANKGSVVLAGLFDNLATNKFCYSCSFYSLEYGMICYFDSYASPADVVSLIALHGKPDKNALETLLLKPYTNPYYLYDLLATKYLREGQVKSAAQALQKVPDEFWYSFSNASNHLDQDPFLENAGLLTSPTMTTYNKREILEKMIQLETEAAGNSSRRAANYFQLANAWYNFTDNSWFMISYGRGWSPQKPFERVDAFAIQKAIGYYRRALAVTTDAETRVKILYMLAALSDGKSQRTYAKEYEQYSETGFYTRRSCLTLKDLAG